MSSPVDYGLNCTEKGLQNLSRLVNLALERNNMSAPQLIKACASVRHKTSEKQVRRLLKAEYSLYPPIDLIFAISLLKIVQHADGTPWSFEDLTLVLFELIDPFNNTGKKPGIAYLRLAIAAVLEIRGERSTEEFAKACNLPVARMRAILDGAVPDLMEIIKISSQSVDHDSERLAGFYLAYMKEQNKANSQPQQSLKISRPPQCVERICQ